MVSGVVVVGQVALYAGHLNVIDALVAQHLLGHVTASHAVGQRYLGEFLELSVQVGLHNVAEQGNSNKDYPDKAHSFYFFGVKE